jgi:hypothetical protein
MNERSLCLRIRLTSSGFIRRALAIVRMVFIRLFSGSSLFRRFNRKLITT